MNKVVIPITFVSYLHSGRGYVSLSFRSAAPTPEMLDFLGVTRAANDDKAILWMSLEGVSFRGSIKSIISRKSKLVFTIHVTPSGFLLSKFFNMAGKAGLSLTISRLKRGEEDKDAAKPGRLGSEEYLSLKNRVLENLKRVSVATGREIAEVIYGITTFKGRDGVERKGLRTLEGMSPGQLKYLDRRLEAMLKEETQGQKA